MLKLMDVLGEALAAARRIEDAGSRAWALIAIAGTQALAGDTQGAARSIGSIKIRCARLTGERQGVRVPWNEGVTEPRFSASRASVLARGQAKRR